MKDLLTCILLAGIVAFMAYKIGEVDAATAGYQKCLTEMDSEEPKTPEARLHQKLDELEDVMKRDFGYVPEGAK